MWLTFVDFSQSVQHFVELHTRQTKDLKKEGAYTKELKKDLGKYKKEVNNLKSPINAKVKEAAENKDFFEKEIKTYKDQLADLEKAMDTEKPANEEAGKKAS